MNLAPKLEPHSIEAEQSVLGAILLDNACLAIARGIVAPENFYRTAHQTIYRAMIWLSDRDEVIDSITLSDTLHSKSQLVDIGGSSYLAELVAIVPSAANIAHHARITAEKATLRKVRHRLMTATEAVDNGARLEQVSGLFQGLTGAETTPVDPVSRITYRRASDIQARPIRWLWPGRIAQGKVSIIAGNPGLGKSQVTVGMAATVSTGGLWPVDRQCCEVGNVIILSAEDDPSDTIRPRLEAAGADLSRVYILDAVTDSPSVSGDETPRAFNLKTDIAQLESMLKDIGGAALVIIDPVTAYLGNTDSHKNAEIRALLSPLAELAGQYGAAVVAVTHFNKNANTEALMRVTGSLAFVAAARAAYVVAKDPENEARRLFLPLKNNLGNDQTGLAFIVESAQVESMTGMIETSRVVWESSAVTVTAEEAMKPQVHDEERSDLDDAKDFLRGLLADGPVPSKQIERDAKGAGHAWRTIQRAQKALGIVAVKKGMKEGWVWQFGLEECQEPPKNAVPLGWHSSYSSGGVGGLQGDDTLPVEVEI